MLRHDAGPGVRSEGVPTPGQGESGDQADDESPRDAPRMGSDGQRGTGDNGSGHDAVDHDARRRELADAAITVIAREGLAGSTLALVADEAGWSIGSMRHYFPTKTELLASALWRVGERVDDRIRGRAAGGMTVADLRGAVVHLLTTPRRTSKRWALKMLDDHLAALRPPSP